MDFAAAQVRHVRIEQPRKRAQDAALGLSAQSQKNEIMPGQYRVDDLRHHRIVVADDAGKDGPTAAQARDQVVAHFVFDAAIAQPVVRKTASCCEARPGSAEVCSKAGYLQVTSATLAQRTE